MSSIDPIHLGRHRLRNWLQSLLLLAGMVWIISTSLRLIFGIESVFWLMLLLAALMLFMPRLSPALLLRMYRARELSEFEAPELFSIIRSLSERAELVRMPRVFYVPSQAPNAFAMGRIDDAVIGVSDGLLSLMNTTELAGVLAHEISHIRHHDTWIMGLADFLGRVTWSLSWTGQILLMLNLPLLLIGYPVISWAGLLMLIFAPHASALLQLAISRTREFEADIGSVLLTGRPEWLIAALSRLEDVNRGWERILMPDTGGIDASLLRTHPPTGERIRRLESLRGQVDPANFGYRPTAFTSPLYRQSTRAPNRHWGGLWY